MDFTGYIINHKEQEYKILEEDGTFFKCKRIPNNGTTYYFLKSVILNQNQNEVIRKPSNGKAG